LHCFLILKKNKYPPKILDMYIQDQFIKMCYLIALNLFLSMYQS